jgi:hypothetical protein
MKQDIKDFVNQKCRSKYNTVNRLPGFLDAQNSDLFVMSAHARFQIKFEKTESYMVPIFLRHSSFDCANLTALLNKMHAHKPPASRSTTPFKKDNMLFVAPNCPITEKAEWL